MSRRVFAIVVPLSALAACSSPKGPYPTLAPRAAEVIDPRVPVEKPVIVNEPSTTLRAQLANLISEAQAGDAAFEAAISAAERSASGSGGPGSESWVQGQQALSAAQAARVRTTRALGDVDAITARSLQTTGGIPAGDLIAVQQAAAAIAEIDRRQAERLKAIQARLGG
ncbi:MAG: hypothetical protein HOP96_04740 [Sphingomonas sp.]|nr:hypothetical protein [Sphingomonas sp.]